MMRSLTASNVSRMVHPPTIIEIIDEVSSRYGPIQSFQPRAVSVELRLDLLEQRTDSDHRMRHSMFVLVIPNS